MGKSDETNAEFLRERYKALQHIGVNMVVKMTIHMGEGQARILKPLKLGSDLLKQFPAGSTVELVAKTNNQWIIGKQARGIHQMRNLPGRQNRPPHTNHQMQTNTESWMLPGKFNGFRKSFSRHHQTGTGEDSIGVGLDDGLVDGVRMTKVISIDDNFAFARPQVWWCDVNDQQDLSAGLSQRGVAVR